MQDMHMWRGKLNAWLNKLVPSLFVLLLFLHQLLNCSLVRDSLVTEYIFTALIGANTSTNRYRHVDLDLLIYFRLTSSWGVINLPLNRHLTLWEVTWDTTLHRHSTRHKTFWRPVPFWSCTWKEGKLDSTICPKRHQALPSGNWLVTWVTANTHKTREVGDKWQDTNYWIVISLDNIFVGIWYVHTGSLNCQCSKFQSNRVKNEFH